MKVGGAFLISDTFFFFFFARRSCRRGENEDVLKLIEWRTMGPACARVWYKTQVPCWTTAVQHCEDPEDDESFFLEFSILRIHFIFCPTFLALQHFSWCSFFVLDVQGRAKLMELS